MFKYIGRVLNKLLENTLKLLFYLPALVTRLSELMSWP